MNRTLAPLERVTSSHDFSTTPATYVYNFGYGENQSVNTWCTVDTIANPYVEMELTLPVLITQILFGGRTSTSGASYVTNLTLEYSPPGNKTLLNYYTTETGSIKVN